MLSTRQNEIVTGSLLGDGTIWNNFVIGNLKLQITQSKADNLGIDKNSYLLWFIKEFINFGCSVRPRKFKVGGANTAKDKTKLYDGYVFNTGRNEVWNEWEKRWYIPIKHSYYRRRKIVPKDIILTPLTLCVWHMDDGSNDATNGNITLETQGFTEDEANFLIARLKTDLDINSSIKWENRNGKHQPRIFVGRKSYTDFIEMVKPHVEWDCFKYKLYNTYDKVHQSGENHSQAKVTGKMVLEMIDLKNDGWKQKAIAEKMGISDAAVNLILSGGRWSHLTGIVYKKKLDKVDQWKAVSLSTQGKTPKEIAVELKCNRSTVTRILKKYFPGRD